jgi:putative NIF3 family GTP cyclohydrolase 1 type 2
MDRRSFLVSTTGLVVAGGSAIGEVPAPREGSLKAKDVRAYLLSLGAAWVNPERTADRFLAGDPESTVSGIAVGWMPYRWALEKALALDCNLFVSHEMVYSPPPGPSTEAPPRQPSTAPTLDMFQHEGVRAKRDFIETSGIAILRCHDVWDRIPIIGIPDAWGAALGFSNSIHGTAGDGYYRVYDVKGRTAIDVARQVATKVKPFGEEAVHLIGRPEAPVNRVAIGCGAISVFRRMLLELKIDLAICTNDGFTHWRDGLLAIDLGVPVIVVDHAVSEEPGMVLLAQKLKEAFPQVPVHHIPERCMFTVVSS